jgi:imidazolonepropionase
LQSAKEMQYKGILKNARQIVTVASNGNLLKQGKDEMNDIGVIHDASIVIGVDGKIVKVGPSNEIAKEFNDCAFEYVLDYTGKDISIVPGLCDAHTHPVWTGDRVHEFAMKLQGATYMDIHKIGGGIGFTVEHVRKSSIDVLEKLLIERLERMVRFGTTLVEGKSGYGLNLEGEIKMLKCIHNVAQFMKGKIEIVSNYCGAHSVPKGMSLEEYTREILNEHLPTIKELIETNEISPELIDVFCEKGVFGIPETREILQKGFRQVGLKANFHGDELNPTNSAELGYELDSCLGISHLEHISDKGIVQMAEKGIVGVLLPSTAYVLRINPPPARKMIDSGNFSFNSLILTFLFSGVPVALGSDFNPNAHCLAMPFIMNLACVNMRMTMNESLVAATLNAAGKKSSSKLLI